ncbi:PAS domain-containing protein [Mangrovicoccus algicola]|uniref:PAS domain-containing protein n=1 Tax=Mangrovicoccus algicola TaxID=2771008 RepID=A0A8J6Z5K4_9RHOB|nr:PAS domain-containing protein [Mangrovicoccus algicola]MBE3636725.1 PAS domain-containing protein [Mangrovicoccus algicola]
MEEGLKEPARVVRGLAAPACLIGPGGEVAVANRAMGRFLGCRVAALRGRRPGDLCGGGFGAVLAAARDRVLRDGTPQDCCAAFRRQDGSEGLAACDLDPAGEGRVILRLRPLPQMRIATGAETIRLPAPEHGRILDAAAATGSLGQWYLDMAARRLWATESVFALLGHAPPPGGMDKAWLRARIHPGDLGAAVRAIEDLLRGRCRQVRFELRLRFRDGHFRWFEASSRRMEGGGDAPVICGSLVDIDRRKTAAARLRDTLDAARSARDAAERSAELLRISTEFGGVVAWYYTPATGRVQYTMPPRAALGHPGTALEQPLSEMQDDIHPEDLGPVRAAMAGLVEGSLPRAAVDYRKRHRDGRWLWFSSEAQPLQRPASAGEGPDVLAICGITMDITARKQAEAALRGARDEAESARLATKRTLQLQRIASESAGVVPWYAVPSTGEEEIGTHLAMILGLDPGTRLHRADLIGLVHPGDRPAAQAGFDALLAQGREMALDFRLRHADGGWRWVTSVGRHVEPVAGGLPGMVCGAFVDISARKAAEARLAAALEDAEAARKAAKATAEMLGIAARCGAMGAWRIAPQEGSAWMEAEGFRQLGYAPDAFRPDFAGWNAIIHPGDRAAARRGLIALLRGRTDVFDIEMRLRHGDGSYHWHRSIGRRAGGAEPGQGMVIAGAHTCIDALKQKEGELAAALAAAQEATSVALLRQEVMAITSEAGRIGHFMIYPELDDGVAPDLTYRQLGYEPGEFPCTDAGWRALYHPQDLGPAVERMEALFADRLDVFDCAARMRHKDGSYHWYRVVARKIDRSAEGLPFVLAGAIFNIDSQKDSEARLNRAVREAQEAVERLNALANRAPGALFEYQTDPEGRMVFRYFSAALPDIMGVAPQELAADGSAIYSTILPEDLPGAQRRVEQARRGGEAFEYQHRILHPERGLRWILVKALPYSNPDGTVTWYGNTLDVTDQLEAERRAREADARLGEVHRRLNTIAEKSPGALFELRLDPQGRAEWRYCTPRLPELLGVGMAELQQDAEAALRNLPGPEAAELWATFRAGDAGGTRPGAAGQAEMRFSLFHPARGLRWLMCSASAAAQADGAVIWYGNLMDITERLEVEHRAAEAAAELRHAHERLSNVADIAPVGLYEFRQHPDGSEDFSYVSSRFEDLMGWPGGAAEASPAEVYRRIDPGDLPGILASTRESARSMTPWRARFRLHHPDRGLIWLAGSSIPRKDAAGTIIWTGAIHDVTADVEREAELRHAHDLAEKMRAENERQALHDGLTGLPNRRYFDNVMARRLEEARGSGGRGCVLIRIDLDHFKYVNDTLGHEAGDLVLTRVAQVLRACLRGEDFAARIGGDEFSVLLAPGMTEENAREIVERIQARIAEPLTYDGRLCRFGASFGIAYARDVAQLGPELQIFADAALYKAKAAGRNRMEFFTADLHRGILNDRRLAAEIHAALERDEFVPYFQPQVSARDGRLVGVETLLRWNHPDRGVLAPGEFMHVAEQLRLVPEIDRIMMLKSGGALARWRQAGLVIPKISFNVSSGRMHDPDVVDMARSLATGETKVAFELLESILVEEESEAFKYHVDMIREAGIEIEIDDFGSGHASIIGLMEIAPDALKIDRRIVMPVARSHRSRNLLRAIVEIAETLGIETIAEGVETEDQVAVLRQAGCDMLQGYAFARPLSEEALAAYLRRGGAQRSA